MSQTVGRYQIVEKIGQGGMGVVYKALDPLLQRTVAVKLIGDELTSDADSSERFLREARAAAQLAHKNIITIYDLGDDGGRLYLAMEYLTGASLSAYMQSGTLSIARALDLGIEICNGLAYAHRHDIVHRDIKPANLFVTDAGEVKILDFGLARLVSSSLTRSQSLMGTAHYMAPEQVRGERVDQRADLFAMGAVLYELLASRRAFEAESIASAMFKILEHEPERLEICNPAVPTALAAIVHRALAKEVHERYQSAADVLRDLTACRQALRLGASGFDDMASPSSAVTLVAPASDFVEEPVPSRVWSPRRVRTTALVGALLTLAFVGPYFWWPSRPAISSSPESAQISPALETPTREGSAAVPALPSLPSPPPVPQPQPSTVLSGPGPTPPGDGSRAANADAKSRQAFSETIARLDRARAAAETAGASTLAAAPFRAAVALQVEAQQLAVTGRLTDAMARAVEADARFRAAEIEARAEATARERLRPVEPPPAPARPAEAREEPPAPVEAPRVETRPPVRAPESEVATVNSEGAIREVLAQYIAALENRNLAALKRVWPSLSGNQERAIRTEFANARAVQARFVDPRISVAGDTATLVGTREYMLVTQDGQRLASTTRTTITVHRSGDAWVIERVVHQQ